MLKKLILGAAALTATATAMPSAAEAHHRYGHVRGGGGYHDPYYRHAPRPRGYAHGYYRQGYAQPYYGDGYYGRGYDQGYHGRTYGYRDPYYGRSYRRCGSGTTGAIVGGAAGALLGREIARGSGG
jgi:hypothetical protein